MNMKVTISKFIKSFSFNCYKCRVKGKRFTNRVKTCRKKNVKSQNCKKFVKNTKRALCTHPCFVPSLQLRTNAEKMNYAFAGVYVRSCVASKFSFIIFRFIFCQNGHLIIMFN